MQYQLKKHLRIFACYYRLNLASALEYRASFIMQSFGMALSNSSFLFFWWVAFGQVGGGIAGYSFKDVLFIWAVSSSGYGLSTIFFANANSLTGLIVTGELDSFLLQPCSVLLNFICAKTSLASYGDLIYGIIIMIIFFTGNAAAWLWFACGALMCGLLFAAVILTSHTLTFYIGEADVIGSMVREVMLNFSVYPEGIYGPIARAVMFSLIPAGIAVHVPLRMVHGAALWVAPLALAGAAAYCAAAAWFFYRGLRRYESGNAIVTKM